MGFFSSRKTDGDYFLDSRDNGTSSDKPKVVQVIRSRFYGKDKGKTPERLHNTFISQNATSAQTLSIPNSISSNRPHVRKSHSAANFNNLNSSTSPSAPTSSSMSVSASPIPNRTLSLSERLKSTRAKLSSSYATDTSGATSPIHSNINKTAPGSVSSTNYHTLNGPPSASSSKLPTDKDPSIDTDAAGMASPTPRKATDSATMSLAQRLNELAAANSEGLLSDDEYRILRQNLFERFASSAAVPTENPVVPATLSRSHLRGASAVSEGRASTSRPPSNFIVEVPRSPSIRSHNSIRSGVAGLFQRSGHHKQASSNDFSDSSSIFSGRGSIFRSHLKKKSSSASVRSVGSQQADAISISSKKTGAGSERDFSMLPPQTPRSTAGSIRRMATPPSSFHHSRSFLNENKYAGSTQNAHDDEKLQTSQDIKNEIAAVEAEGRRLMDTFNGLEVTILAKRQRNPHTKAMRIVELEASDAGSDRDSVSGRQGSKSTWTLVPDHKLALKVAAASDADGASIRSGTSVGTSPSISRSMYLRALPSKASNSLISSTTHSRSSSLHRKNSSSSVGSSRAGAAAKSSASSSSRIPPVPALPSNMGQYYGHASNSSLNLARSTGHLPMRSVPEDEVRSEPGDVSMRELDGELDAEMEEIRRRREDVSQRYAARVEYLRAKLKGAQLHEKLMRK
ncbi:hypothetical protein K435DRAFT_196412 [Dendrothele bispora CBS 962.96]|uniref:Uncharacterized protein n=1 Tax=Dendrothele bispora (strain CBS 962.96) TaxID=1314807 RepID=A0A4S8MQ78_DENBC|nr:hypothetical protein K435DRAFT_196412 [Dendrothele bispora CBS 962.96]